MRDLRDIARALICDDRLLLDCSASSPSKWHHHESIHAADVRAAHGAVERLLGLPDVSKHISAALLPDTAFGIVTHWGDTLVERAWRNGLIPGVRIRPWTHRTPGHTARLLRELANLGAALVLLEDVSRARRQRLLSLAAVAQQVGLVPILDLGAGASNGEGVRALWSQLTYEGTDTDSCLLVERPEEVSGNARVRLINATGDGANLFRLSDAPESLSFAPAATSVSVGLRHPARP